MRKIYLPLVLASFLHTLPAAHADITDAAFGDADIANAAFKALPESVVIEAPNSIQSSTENETFVEASNATSPVLVNKEYAGTKVWGELCNIVNTPTGQYKWSINRYNLETDTVETIFGVSNNRKIQSVACEPSGYGVLFSMKETLGGDYEIYSLNPGEENSLFKLTDNDTDDVDVTASWDGSAIAWQQRLPDGRQAILLNRENPNDYFSPIVKSLASASPFVQPSLSPNGKWLTFVQLRPSFFAVMRYDIENNKYLEIRTIPRRKRLFHPSISNDGNIIGWAENRKQNRYMVKNLSENTLTQLLNNPNGIEHASISAQGDLVAYSVNADTKRQTYMTNLETLATTRVGNILYGTNRYLGTSWLGTSLEDIQPEEISGQSFVGLDGPIVLTFNSDGTGQEISNGDGDYSNYPDPYSQEFSWMVDNNQLFIDYTEEEFGFVNVSKAGTEVNKYTIIGEDSDGESGVVELYKALPLNAAELDEKVMSLDMSEDTSCTAMTFAFEGNDVLRTGVCDDTSENIDLEMFTLSQDPSIENTLVLSSQDGSNEQNSFILIKGSVSSGTGKVVFFGSDSEGNPDKIVIHDVTFEDKTLASLVVGKTLYRHVEYYGDNGVDTIYTSTNGQLIYTDYREGTETIPYRIMGNTLLFLADDPQNNEGAMLAESTSTYVRFADGVNDFTTFYYNEADALAGPVDSGEATILLDDGISNTAIKFVDRNNNALPIPSDALIRITPVTFTSQGRYNYGINCVIQPDGSFEDTCFARLNYHDELLAAMDNPLETYQIVVYQNHINPNEPGWDCGEDVYKFVGSSVSNWSNITVLPSNFQDRNNEHCD